MCVKNKHSLLELLEMVWRDMGTLRLLCTCWLIDFITQSVSFRVNLLPIDVVILGELWHLDSIIIFLTLLNTCPILQEVLSVSIDNVMALGGGLYGAEFACRKGADFEGTIVFGKRLLCLGSAWVVVTLVVGSVMVVCGGGTAFNLVTRTILLFHLSGWISDGISVSRTLKIILPVIGLVIMEVVAAIVSIHIAIGVFWTNFSSLSLLVVSWLFFVIFAAPTNTHNYHYSDNDWKDDD